MDDSIQRRFLAQPLYRLLADHKRWIRWRLELNPQGRLTKKPLGSTRHPQDWSTLREALADWAVDETQGIGLVLSGGIKVGDGVLVCLDLDGCRDPATGVVADWAQEILNVYGLPFTELSPSGYGLHPWLVSRELPELGRSKVHIDAKPPEGCAKRAELQVFAAGTAYVTCTARPMLGTSTDPRETKSLQWLIDEFELGAQNSALPALPTGRGPVPSLEEIAKRVLAAAGEHLVNGDWQRFALGDTDKSASEVFAILERHALDAANGHGRAALDYLLSTAWGRGDIHDSADPLKYSRAAWVSKDLARIATKRPVVDVQKAFAAPVVASALMPAAPPPVSSLLEDLSAFLAHQQQGAEFLIFELIPSTGMGQFFGDPSCGKTPFALSLSMHVAFSQLTHWFGHEIDVHGPVVYMIGEGRDGLRKRAQAELQIHGIELGDDGPFKVTTVPGQLSDAADVPRWIAAVKQEFPNGIRLLTIDTQSQNFGSGNENETEHMNRFVRHCAELIRALHCCILLVHHMGHGDKTRSRGSTVLHAALDFSFLVERSGKFNVTASCTKAKDWAEPAPLRGHLEVITVGLDHKQRPRTAVVLRDKPRPVHVGMNELRADSDLVELLKAAARLTAGGESPFSQRALMATAGLARTVKTLPAVERALELKLLEKKAAPLRATGKSARVGKMAYVLTPAGSMAAAACAESGAPPKEKNGLESLLE